MNKAISATSPKRKQGNTNPKRKQGSTPSNPGTRRHSRTTIRVLSLCLAFLILPMITLAQTSQPTSLPEIEVRPIRSPEAKRQAAVELIDRFIVHVRTAASIEPSARTTLTDAWARHRTEENPVDFLTAGLAIISKPFHDALQAVEQQQYEQAEQTLRPLLDNPDPYVTLHAQIALARLFIEQDRYEEAEPLLASLANREQDLIVKTFAEAEVDFLLGYCRLANLKYDEALTDLEKFERQHPDAEDQYRLPARQMIQELKARQPESLGEVSDLMTYAARRLTAHGTYQTIRQRQDRAIELLDRLIQQAEDQEKQGSNTGCKQCGGKGCPACQKPGGNPLNPSRPMDESRLPSGASQIGELRASPRARPGEAWGKMPPKEREQILQSLRQNFPSRYRQLIEQYYLQLGKEP